MAQLCLRFAYRLSPPWASGGGGAHPTSFTWTSHRATSVHYRMLSCWPSTFQLNCRMYQHQNGPPSIQARYRSLFTRKHTILLINGSCLRVFVWAGTLQNQWTPTAQIKTCKTVLCIRLRQVSIVVKDVSSTYHMSDKSFWHLVSSTFDQFVSVT